MSIQRLARLGAVSILVGTGGSPTPRAPSVLRPNPNTERAGAIRNGVLTVSLEAKESLWRLDGPDRPPMTLEAFSEPGKAPLMPGPLVRAPAGTDIHLTVHNALQAPLTFFVPAAVHGSEAPPEGDDSVVIAPGAVGTLTTRAVTPGNYMYRATTPTGASQKAGMAGVLVGAMIIDSAGAPTHPSDRVFVLMGTPDSALVAFSDTSRAPLAAAEVPYTHGGLVYTINGRSWPATERIHATAGDSLHWRILNTSAVPHPMHLHGFYFRVDDYSTPDAARFGRAAPGQMAVTQLMAPFSTMSMTWSPDRPGNWLFHCHFALHNTPHSATSMQELDMPDMVGLVLGIDVAARPGVAVAGHPADPVRARRFRLVATADGSSLGSRKDSVPAMHFVLEENGRETDAGRDFSPELDLVRGEPVAITIVNHMAKPTTIHWHGIELEDSYMDGVAGFSGSGKRLTPAIAPGDSFVARFTPPRAGTFMYHAHVDDALEQLGGLEGALIVRDRDTAPSDDDHVLFLKGLGGGKVHPLEIDGHADPDTLILHAGHAARLRLISLATVNVAPVLWLTARPDSAAAIGRDTMLVRWRALAKDGFDVPVGQQRPKPAQQTVAIGETYDFEYTPTTRGNLRLELRTNGPRHPLLIRVPIRVE